MGVLAQAGAAVLACCRKLCGSVPLVHAHLLLKRPLILHRNMLVSSNRDCDFAAGEAPDLQAGRVPGGQPWLGDAWATTERMKEAGTVLRDAFPACEAFSAMHSTELVHGNPWTGSHRGDKFNSLAQNGKPGVIVFKTKAPAPALPFVTCVRRCSRADVRSQQHG